MITRTEVLKAIAACEGQSGWGPLDMSLATGIQKGPLHVLIEAAKCARYECIGGHVGEPPSNSDAVLDYEPAQMRDEAKEGA